jgi:hypothetical protein
MGDMGDLYNALRQQRQEEGRERAGLAGAQTATLIGMGHAVRQLGPDGPHLRIDEAYDYWPSSGRWRALQGRSKGKGFQDLCRFLAKRSPPGAPKPVSSEPTPDGDAREAA